MPCGHAYCRGCLAELRAKDVAQKCPLCRDSLPPGLDGLYKLGSRAYLRVRGRVDRGEMSWTSLPASEQEAMDDAVAVLTEAAAQGHMDAQMNLGHIYGFGRGVAKDDGRAFSLYGMAARQGETTSCNAEAYYNLARHYEDGKGVTQSIAKARRHYELASTHGFTDASNDLQRLERD